MKKYLVGIIVVSLVLGACTQVNEKEIGEVDGLINILGETEKTLLSVDTSRAFSAKRQIAQDLMLIESTTDTLDKETAFKLGDYYAGKKRLIRFSFNYASFISTINVRKNQLANLKQDLTNGLITKEKFPSYYQEEQAAVLELNTKVNKSVGGIEVAIQKMELDRDEILQIFEALKKDSPQNGE